MRHILKSIIMFYQRYVTIIFGYGSCRYYPTCSEYAKWQIENNQIYKAIFFSFLRILRCNQLFKGGIEYPTIKKEFNFSLIQKRKCGVFKVKYWYIRKKDNIFYVIKEFKGSNSV